MPSPTKIHEAEQRILRDLMQHAEDHELPLTPRQVAAQARIAALAALDGQQVSPAPLPRSQRPVPHDPDAPVWPTGIRPCDAPECGEPVTVGWRKYRHLGWVPVCSRHMTAASRPVRRYNHELAG